MIIHCQQLYLEPLILQMKHMFLYMFLKFHYNYPNLQLKKPLKVHYLYKSTERKELLE